MYACVHRSGSAMSPRVIIPLLKLSTAITDHRNSTGVAVHYFAGSLALPVSAIFAAATVVMVGVFLGDGLQDGWQAGALLRHDHHLHIREDI